MHISQEILSQITIFQKYAKYIPSINRRETWDEIVDRYQAMMITKYPQLKEGIILNTHYIREKKILPSMRMLQFAGAPIWKNHSRGYNCSYLPIDDYRAFSEIMFLLLGGVGCGYSVQKHHIAKLPPIMRPEKRKKYLIGDTLESWADSVKALIKAYFGYTNYLPVFDFSDIRPKGARLITTGGKAPGAEPLKECLFQIQKILDRKQNGEQLNPIDAHDIVCHIANAVLAGGIRRSACISLFSIDDEEMLTCKYGNWWELNEQRGRCNNSAVLVRGEVTEDEFKELWKKIELSSSGEPGVYWTDNKELGTNPCAEISLKPFSFCNLCEVNVSDAETQKELNNRVSAAAFFGTLQAGFTDFHYLRPIWRKTSEDDALIGVGMTGIASGLVGKLNLNEAADAVKKTNKKVAEIIGINTAARCTTIKPSGTSSCVLGTSSGIHAWHNDYYIRTQRIGKNESIYTYLAIYHPELIEDDFFRPSQQAVISIPQAAPCGATLRTEPALSLLERVKRFNIEWVREGHRRGDNYNNVSATISVKDEEWEIVGEWMWNNRDAYNGISVLPYSDHTYVQAPFQDITKEKYEELVLSLNNIDLTKVIELDDNVDFGQEVACSSGKCELN